MEVPVHTTDLLSLAYNVLPAFDQPGKTINNRMMHLHWNTVKQKQFTFWVRKNKNKYDKEDLGYTL